MNSNINDEKLKEAKAKLACHIEPPKGSAYARMLAESQGAGDPAPAAASADDSSCSISSCGQSSAPSDRDRIRLTEMTSAGG